MLGMIWQITKKHRTVMGNNLNLTSLLIITDFKTNGDTSVRNTTDYRKNYFVSYYGAIEDVDFTDIVLEMLKTEDTRNT